MKDVKKVVRGTLRFTGFCMIMNAFKEIGLLSTEKVGFNATWTEYLEKRLGKAEIAEIKKAAKTEHESLKMLQDDVSQAVIHFMAEKNIGFNDLVEMTGKSPAQNSKIIKGEANLEGVDIESFSNYLYTAGLPDPDLLIRTSGEMRISNFLLWQLSYAELYFPRKYWPDFGEKDLEKAIDIYQRRERKFSKAGRKDVNKEDN